ncbi:hypothetical protein CRG98_040761 [Punica granatum]|uniref:PB1-like domain-containing protein n=1 Tax=Punica granatum TaxID=22663 RepID=A0A2I0I4I2_PUNGR|nr:hypothetical protein CRG98_040761 [Punica granatum]
MVTVGINRFSCKPLDRSDPTPGSLSPRCLNSLIGYSKYTVYPVPLDPGDSTALDLRVVNSKWRLLPTRVRRASPGRIPDRRARGLSVELVKLVYCYQERSKLEYSWSRFAQEIDHHGPTNCNAKIVNRFLDAQAYSSFGFSAQLDQFIDFTVSKRASQVYPVPLYLGDSTALDLRVVNIMSEDDYYIVVFHHGGVLVSEPQMEYIGGVVDSWDNVDIDRISIPFVEWRDSEDDVYKPRYKDESGDGEDNEDDADDEDHEDDEDEIVADIGSGTPGCSGNLMSKSKKPNKSGRHVMMRSIRGDSDDEGRDEIEPPQFNEGAPFG